MNHPCLGPGSYRGGTSMRKTWSPRKSLILWGGYPPHKTIQFDDFWIIFYDFGIIFYDFWTIFNDFSIIFNDFWWFFYKILGFLGFLGGSPPGSYFFFFSWGYPLDSLGAVILCFSEDRQRFVWKMSWMWRCIGSYVFLRVCGTGISKQTQRSPSAQGGRHA